MYLFDITQRNFSDSAQGNDMKRFPEKPLRSKLTG